MRPFSLFTTTRQGLPMAADAISASHLSSRDRSKRGMRSSKSEAETFYRFAGFKHINSLEYNVLPFASSSHSFPRWPLSSPGRYATIVSERRSLGRCESFFIVGVSGEPHPPILFLADYRLTWAAVMALAVCPLLYQTLIYLSWIMISEISLMLLYAWGPTWQITVLWQARQEVFPVL